LSVRVLTISVFDWV